MFPNSEHKIYTQNNTIQKHLGAMEGNKERNKPQLVVRKGNKEMTHEITWKKLVKQKVGGEGERRAMNESK